MHYTACVNRNRRYRSGATRARAWWLGLATTLGCEARPTESDAPSTAPSPSVLAAPASVASPLALAPSMPGPDRRRGDLAAHENARCVGCHEEEGREWSASRHREAYTSRPFLDSLREEPAANAPFCRGCHAPEADPREPPSAPLAELGVGCITCHLTDDATTVRAAGAELRGEPATARMPHPIERTPAFAQTGACASCHEFRFPLAHGAEDAVFMQTTVREHARAPAAERSCASCHMPRRAGHRSHSFDVRDPAWLREAVTAKASMDAAGLVVITLAQKDAGHALPTGDLFRRLEVGAAWGPLGVERERVVQHLERRFVSSERAPFRELVEDDRVFFEPTTIELAFQGAPSERDEVRYWVSLQRVAQVGAGDPARATIESEVTLASGTLRAAGPNRSRGDAGPR